MSQNSMGEFTKEGLEKVAMLSRLSLTDSEKEKFLGEIKDILNFVSHIQDMATTETQSSDGKEYGEQFVNSVNKNIMREDKIENQGGEYTEEILANAPVRVGNFIEVTQVLEKFRKKI